MIRRKFGSADMVQNEPDAALVSDPPGLRHDILGAIEDDIISAIGAREAAFSKITDEDVRTLVRNSYFGQ